MLVSINSRDDVWLNNGLTNLARMIKELGAQSGAIVAILPDRVEFDIHNVDMFIDNVGQKVITDRDRYIFLQKTKNNGNVGNVRKDYICLQYGKSQGGQNVLKEQAYNPDGIKNLLEAFLIQYNQSQGAKTKTDVCILCGDSYAYTKRGDELKQAAYPFITRNKAMSNIRSKMDKEDYVSPPFNFKNVCPTCYLIGTMEWCDPAHIFLTQFNKKRSYLFLPNIRRLDELYRFKNNYATSLVLDNIISSVRLVRQVNGANKEYYAQGSSSLLLAFLEKALSQPLPKTRASIFDTTAISYFRNWLMMEIPSGNMRDIRSWDIDIEPEILQAIGDAVDEGLFPYQSLVVNMWIREFGSNGTDYDMTDELREKAAQAFLNDDFDNFTSAMAPTGKNYSYLNSKYMDALENLIILWRWRRVRLNNDDLKTVQQVARIIAKVAEDHANLLFRLDKVRSISDLLSLLREIGRRYTFLDEADRKYLNPSALARITEMLSTWQLSEQDFEDFKNALAVFSYAYVGQEQYFTRKEGEE